MQAAAAKIELQSAQPEKRKTAGQCAIAVGTITPRFRFSFFLRMSA
jgi:hypothetical protein